MLSQILFGFFFYAILGWCVEVAYNARTQGRFINAGLLNGPWCPIYGIGMMAVIHLLGAVQDHLLGLFLGAVIITSLLELVTGILLEGLFHQKWWDYSDRAFNLGGYICLPFSLAWGLGSVVLVRLVQPLVLRLFAFTPVVLSRVSLVILVLLLLADVIVTVNSIFKLNRKLETMTDLSRHMRDASDDLGEALASGVFLLEGVREDLADQFDETRTEIRQQLGIPGRIADEMEYSKRVAAASDTEDQVEASAESVPLFGERRLVRAFPHLKSGQYDEAWKQLQALHRKNLRVIRNVTSRDQADS